MNPLTWWFDYYRGATDSYLARLEQWRLAAIDQFYWSPGLPPSFFERDSQSVAPPSSSELPGFPPAPPIDAGAERFMSKLIASSIERPSARYVPR